MEVTVHAMCTLGPEIAISSGRRSLGERAALSGVRLRLRGTTNFGLSASRAVGLTPTVAVTCGSTLGRTLGTEVNAKSCATASRVKMQYRLHLALCTSYVQQVPRIPPKDEHGTFPNSVLLPAAFLLHYAKAVRAHTLGAMNVHHAKYQLRDTVL